MEKTNKSNFYLKYKKSCHIFKQEKALGKLFLTAQLHQSHEFL